MTASDKTNESKWEEVEYSDFMFQIETKGESGSWIILFNFLGNI